MKGYFSRIARQSGLRIAGQSTASAARPATQPPLPLEREEVVMVPPSFGEAPSHVLSRRTPEEGSVIGGLNETRLQDSPAANTARESRTEHTTEPSAARTSDEGKIESPVDGETIPATVQGRVQVNQTRVESGPEDGPKPSRKSKKDFFSQTAEIIGGRDLQRSEAQSVVIREIQEWAASGWNDAAMLEAPTVDESLDDVDIRSKVIETGAGVIRIMDERTTEQPSEVRDIRNASSIEESTFDLSIGSVTVVIEGEQTASSKPTHVQQHDQPVARTTPPRLRRSYL